MEDEDVVPLPGFRFRPTDEEIVGFYLRRKVDEKPLSVEVIKEMDIYKYDPWDLPSKSNPCFPHRDCVGSHKLRVVVGLAEVRSTGCEEYFFCRRGRKYKNSIRPNRVTGSGFWKATGVDRPIYAAGNSGDCIGLKKSLVFYSRGRTAAAKGTKTEWMMHEFRLPCDSPCTQEAVRLPRSQLYIYILHLQNCQVLTKPLCMHGSVGGLDDLSSLQEECLSQSEPQQLESIRS